MTDPSTTVEAVLAILPVAIVALVARWHYTKSLDALAHRLHASETRAADKVARLKSQVEALTEELHRQRSTVARLTVDARTSMARVAGAEAAHGAMQEPFEETPRRRPSLGFEDTQIL